MQYVTSSTITAYVRLFNSTTGLPATGVASGSVTATAYKANGTTASITVNGSTWTEITTGAFSGQGFYSLSISNTVTNVAGLFVYAVSGTNLSSFLGQAELLDQLPASVYTRLGAPVGASISADIAGVQTTASSINTKIGTPVSTVSADIAGVRGAQNLDLSTIAGGVLFTSPTDTLHNIAASVTSGAGVDISAIASAVWNEAMAGHVTAGSAAIYQKYTLDIKTKTDNLPADPASQAAILGPQSINLSTIAGGVAFSSVADNLHQINANINLIPDTTWSTVLTGYVTANTAGQKVNAIKAKTDNLPAAPASQGDVTTSTASIKGADSRDLSQLAGSGWNSTTDTLKNIEATITSGGINPTAIVNAIWNEPQSGHNTAGTFGGNAGIIFTKTSNLPTVPSSQSDVTSARDSIKGTDNRNLTQLAGTGWSSSTDTLQQISLAIPDAPPSAETIAQTVWDEATSGHNVGGTFGRSVSDTRNATDNIYNRIGAPVGASISADISAIKTDTGTVSTINTKIGTPVTSVSADIAAVKSDTGTINTKIGTPVSTVSADIASVKSTANRIQALKEGRWKIFTSGPDANRMVLYDKDGTTVLQKWDMKDSAGTGTTTTVFERVNVLSIP